MPDACKPVQRCAIRAGVAIAELTRQRIARLFLRHSVRVQKEIAMSKVGRGVLSFLVLVMAAGTAHASTVTINDVMITTTLVGDAIDVDVTNIPGGSDYGLFGDSGANRAFGFNVMDPDGGVTI